METGTHKCNDYRFVDIRVGMTAVFPEEGEGIVVSQEMRAIISRKSRMCRSACAAERSSAWRGSTATASGSSCTR